MDRSTAEEFLEAAAWMEGPLGLMDSALSKLEGAEKEKYQARVASLFQSQFELLMGIINAFPELDPDGKGAETYKALKKKHAQ